MSTMAPERPATRRPLNGGVPARRAVIRWAVRLLRHEWRQQLLILALITVAVAATVVGSAVATTTPSPATAAFGTAQDLATFTGPAPRVAAEIASISRRFGTVDVIENQTFPVPGSIQTYSLRAQDPRGPFGQPMLSLISGQFPVGAGQVAVTSGVASDFHLVVGSTWTVGGVTRKVTGIVANPQNLLDEFALVAPGQVTAPTQVTVLFDARGVSPSDIGPTVATPQTVAAKALFNPETISLAAVVLGMLLIALVGAGGFTVLARRRLRSIGMLAAQGATRSDIRLVVRANGVATGAVGATAGFALGLAAWLAYRPHVQASGHHVIGVFQLPWTVIWVSMVLRGPPRRSPGFRSWPRYPGARPPRIQHATWRFRSVSDSWLSRSSCSASPAPAWAAATPGTAQPSCARSRVDLSPSWSLWCCCPRPALRCWPGSAAGRRSWCALHCGTWPGTAPGRARHSGRSASAC
jgi:putative ABC transport system permease protein